LKRKLANLFLVGSKTTFQTFCYPGRYFPQAHHPKWTRDKKMD